MQISDRAVVLKFNKAQDRLVLQASDLSLETIASMVASRAIDITPQYQRRERWTHKGQSKLIESFLLNIPIPPVYLAEDDFGTYSVIDGKQRLTTIHRFMRDKLKLVELETFDELENAYFKDLPRDLQNALTIRPYLRVVTLLKQSDPEIKYEVFTRLNTGGEPLDPQEIRNALYRGQFNDLLFTLSEEPFFRQQLKIKTLKEPTYLSMADVEFVLRFFTIRESWKNFEGDYRRSMDGFMDRHKGLGADKCAKFGEQFKTALARVEKIWGDAAFKRYEAGISRNQFLAAVYDAQMVACSELSVSQFNSLLHKKVEVRRATEQLFLDKKFESSVRVATNNKSNVRYRVKSLQDALKEIAAS